MFLLFLVVCGVIALVIVKVINPNKKKIQDAAADVPLPNVTDIVNTATGAVKDALAQAGQPSGRRLMQQMIFEALDF